LPPTVLDSTKPSEQTATPVLSTQVPTFPPNVAQSTFYNLLQDNGGCQFPCWWGLTPGVTDMITFRSLLDTFESISVSNIQSENGGYFNLHVQRENRIIELQVEYYSANSETVDRYWISTSVIQRTDEGYEVLYGDPLYADVLKSYTLTDILSTYGAPSNVMIYQEEGFWWFSLIMYFRANGIFVEFLIPLEIVGETYIGCPSNAITHLWLWSPKHNFAISEILSMGVFKIRFMGPSSLYIPVDEATDLSIDDFVQVFSDPENSSCLETPIELWQGS
jgi:hypothetical protein